MLLLLLFFHKKKIQIALRQNYNNYVCEQQAITII